MPAPSSRQEARSSLVVRLVSFPSPRSPRHTRSLLTAALSCPSGCPPEGETRDCKNTFGGFQGCMRLLSVDSQPVDLMMVQQRLLGNYSQLQIDMCGITDRSVPQRHCAPHRLHRVTIFLRRASLTNTTRSSTPLIKRD